MFIIAMLMPTAGLRAAPLFTCTTVIPQFCAMPEGEFIHGDVGLNLAFDMA